MRKIYLSVITEGSENDRNLWVMKSMIYRQTRRGIPWLLIASPLLDVKRLLSFT